MSSTNVVCGMKTCRNYSDNGCMKKAIILSAKGKCLSAELETAAEAAAQAEGAAAEISRQGKRDSIRKTDTSLRQCRRTHRSCERSGK